MNLPRLALILLLFSLSSIASAQSLDTCTEQEIAHLFTFIKGSPCRFYRNGEWHSSMEAAEHIDKKYRYVLKRNLIHDTDDFIRYTATQSFLSGKRYQVECPDAEPM